MMESAVLSVINIRQCVQLRHPEADGEWTNAETERVLRVYCTLVLEDAIDDLKEVVRNWTP
jgi:hypothetical protein